MRKTTPTDSPSDAAPPSPSAKTDRLRRRRRVDWDGLRADLTATVPDAAAGLVVTIGVFVWLYYRARSGDSPTVALMPELADADQYWLYWLCEAFGWSALLWAWGTIMLGLLRSSTPPTWLPLSHRRIERLHRTTSLTTIGLIFGHALAWFIEQIRANADQRPWPGRIGAALGDTFVPGVFGHGSGQISILVGLIAFYLAIPLSLAYYTRRTTGPRVWLVLHRFIIVVYVLSVWHTLLYGTNVWFDGNFRTVVWLLQIPPAALLIYRLVAPARRSQRLHGRRPLALVVGLLGRFGTAAAIVLILVIAVSGNDGGRTPDGPGTDPVATTTMVWTGLVILLITIAVSVHRAARGPRSDRS